MQSEIERHSHIVYNLGVSWGTQRGRNYIEELLFVEPGATRQGFSSEVFSEIQFLLNLHDSTFPQFIPKGGFDAWGTTRNKPSNYVLF